MDIFAIRDYRRITKQERPVDFGEIINKWANELDFTFAFYVISTVTIAAVLGIICGTIGYAKSKVTSWISKS